MLKEGQSVEVKGSGVKPYLIKNTKGNYSCSCPAWRNQSLPTNKRICKHIKRILDPSSSQENAMAKGRGFPVLLAINWEKGFDPSGWWMSEKLDGIRAIWNGKKMYTRHGNEIFSPEWFTKDLPPLKLDGELWVGRGEFQETTSIVLKKKPDDRWKKIKFAIFDIINTSQSFENRQEGLSKIIDSSDNFYILEQVKCKSKVHLYETFDAVTSSGGEGVMMREEGSLYVDGRSSCLQKVKLFLDAEATIIRLSDGEGKHKGELGSMLVEMSDGKRFSIGSGFTSAMRKNPPTEGTLITYKYQELTNEGLPRFPIFLRVRSDKNKNEFSLIFKDGDKNKFWKGSVSNATVTIRFGKVGSKGQARSKDFDDPQKAILFLESKKNEKIKKGYIVNR